MSESAGRPIHDREPHWSAHARDKWSDPRRNDVPDRDPEKAWHDTQRVDYPSAKPEHWGRYYPDGDCVLIVTGDEIDGAPRRVVVTVLPLSDRPIWERVYVRCQVRYGGGSR
jgi:hypothetical protein